MNKLYTSIRSIILVCFSLPLLFACNNEDNKTLDDTIFVKYKGAEMPAHIHGNGEENVFFIILHGGPGGTGLDYRFGTIESELEKECAVVYFDQRSSGMSQGSFSESDVSVDLMAEDVMALVKVITFKYGEDSKFFLMGHSWGGSLGTATLLKDTNQVYFKGWIEVDGGHNLADLYGESWRYYKHIANEQILAGNSIEYWKDVDKELNKINPEVYNSKDYTYLNTEAYASITTLTTDGVIASGDGVGLPAYFSMIYSYNSITKLINGIQIGKVLEDQEKIWESLNYSDQLKNLTIPTLFIWGKYDLVIPPALGYKGYMEIGSLEKEFLLLNKSGHSPMVDQPDEFINAVIAFVKAYK